MPAATRKPETTCRLTDSHPDELEFFKRVFLWTGNPKGYYVRYAYEPTNVGGRWQPKWCPVKNKHGNWQHFYPALVDSLAEKHLDFDRFVQTDKTHLRPKDWETAFWIGTMAGSHTLSQAIDLDAHDYIGWYSVPTRWHQSRTGWAPGPWSFRDIPVIRPSLQFFMRAKVIYDQFPNRIWAFSSGNLGLSVWEMLTHRELSHVVYRKEACRLSAVGLSDVEHFPSPPKGQGSFGQCHRRPCGLDSGIITDDGVITNPIDQIRCFMQPKTPTSFDVILSSYWTMLERMYSNFLSVGGGVLHNKLPREHKSALIDECWMVVEQIKEWARHGYPIEKTLLVAAHTAKPTTPPTSPPELVPHILSRTGGEGEIKEDQVQEQQNAIPEMFWQVDMPSITRSGRWLHFVRFLVENGFPKEDTFYDVISTLAKWFGFIEMYGQPPAEVSEILRTYVLRKNNGMISRLQNGEEAEVLAHVDRIVSNVLDNEGTSEASIFEDLRRKRATGAYANKWAFAQRIREDGAALPSLNALPQSTGTAQAQMVEEQKWSYEPDDTPLPDFVVEKLRSAFRDWKQQLRRNEAGRYPTLDAITRFINYLLAGRRAGQRRASKLLLIMMGFPSNGTKRGRIMRVLLKEGFVSRGGYRSRESSRLWILASWVVEASQQRLTDGVEKNPAK